MKWQHMARIQSQDFIHLDKAIINLETQTYETQQKDTKQPPVDERVWGRLFDERPLDATDLIQDIGVTIYIYIYVNIYIYILLVRIFLSFGGGGCLAIWHSHLKIEVRHVRGKYVHRRRA